METRLDPYAGVSKEAPDFTLVDTEGREVRLSNYRGRKNVVLVFNRGLG